MTPLAAPLKNILATIAVLFAATPLTKGDESFRIHKDFEGSYRVPGSEESKTPTVNANEKGGTLDVTLNLNDGFTRLTSTKVTYHFEWEFLKGSEKISIQNLSKGDRFTVRYRVKVNGDPAPTSQGKMIVTNHRGASKGDEPNWEALNLGKASVGGLSIAKSRWVNSTSPKNAEHEVTVTVSGISDFASLKLNFESTGSSKAERLHYEVGYLFKKVGT